MLLFSQLSINEHFLCQPLIASQRPLVAFQQLAPPNEHFLFFHTVHVHISSLRPFPFFSHSYHLFLSPFRFSFFLFLSPFRVSFFPKQTFAASLHQYKSFDGRQRVGLASVRV